VPDRTSIAARPSLTAVTRPEVVTVALELSEANVTESDDSGFPKRSVTCVLMSHAIPGLDN
jgi:hypothetical protein